MKKQPRKPVNTGQLYFLGLLPPDPIRPEITAFKQDAFERFKAGHALTSPPHITLIPPFRSDRTDFSVIADFAAEHTPVEIQLNGFDKFDQKVIFVDVVSSSQLTALQKNIELFLHYYLGIEPEYRPFHPHITVAFKDLKRTSFPEAWAYFSGQVYTRTFTADTLTLLTYTGKAWDVLDEWAFGR